MWVRMQLKPGNQYFEFPTSLSMQEVLSKAREHYVSYETIAPGEFQFYGTSGTSDRVFSLREKIDVNYGFRGM